MFTLRVERRAGRRDVFEAESYSVSESKTDAGFTRLLLVGQGANTPSHIDIEHGDRCYIMNGSGQTVDSIQGTFTQARSAQFRATKA